MNALNSKQKQGLWLGIIMAVAVGVYPPWVEGGAGGAPASYAPIFAPPQPAPGHPNVQIDFSRVFLQWAMIAMITGGLVASGKEREPSAGIPGGFTGAQGPAPRSNQAGQVVSTQPAKPATRKLKFPESHSIGGVLVESEDDPDYWEWLADAKGVVETPSSGRLQLELPKDETVELGALGQPEMSAIVSIDASDSKISDDQLALVAALKNLQELDLSNTSVSNAGMQHLTRLKNLEKIWLDGTAVTDEGLSVLAQLPRLKKVSCANTSINDSAVISLKDQAKDCQFVLSSGQNA